MRRMTAGVLATGLLGALLAAAWRAWGPVAIVATGTAVGLVGLDALDGRLADLTRYGPVFPLLALATAGLAVRLCTSPGAAGPGGPATAGARTQEPAGAGV